MISFPAFTGPGRLEKSPRRTTSHHFSGVGFGMKADGPYKRRSNDIRHTPICISRGNDGEFDSFFTVFSRARGELQRAILNVRPRYVPD
jgi:hypothetical protein